MATWTITGESLQGPKGDKGDPGTTSWSGITGKPSTFPPSSHTHTASQISDSTSTGRAVVTAASASAARSAIGAGTSDLTLGSTSSTAMAGDKTAADLGGMSQAHIERRPALYSGTGDTPGSGEAPGAVVGDWWLDVSDMSLYKIASL